MANSKVHKFEQQSSLPPSLKANPRPAPKRQVTHKESLPVDPETLLEEDQKNLVLKLIDFLETF